MRIIGYSMKTCLTSPEPRSREEIVDEAMTMLLRFVNLPDSWTPAAED
jgi:hypothetical protein